MAGTNFQEEIPEETYCRTCKVNFANWRALFVHKYLSRRHIVCAVCCHEFKTHEGYKRHHDQTHAHEQNLKCPACNEVFARVGAFMSHLELTKCHVLNKAKEAENKEVEKKKNLATFDQIREAGNLGALPKSSSKVQTALYDNPNPSLETTQSPLSPALQTPLVPSLVILTSSRSLDLAQGGLTSSLQPHLVPKTTAMSKGPDNKQQSAEKLEDEDLIDFTLNLGWGSDAIKNQSFPMLESVAPYKGQNILKEPIAVNHQNKMTDPNNTHITTSSANQDLINRWLIVPVAHGTQSTPSNNSGLSQLPNDKTPPAWKYSSKIAPVNEVPTKSTNNSELNHINDGKPAQFTTWAKGLFPNAPPAITPSPQAWPQPVDNSSRVLHEAEISEHNPDSSKFCISRYFVSETQKYKCPHQGCRRSFDRSGSFIQHLRSPTHMEGLEKHQCRSCLNYFNSTTALTQHVESQAVKCHVRYEANFDSYIDGLTRNIVSLKGLHGDDTNAYEVQNLDSEKSEAKIKPEEAGKLKKEKGVKNKGDTFWQENADRIKW